MGDINVLIQNLAVLVDYNYQVISFSNILKWTYLNNSPIKSDPASFDSGLTKHLEPDLSASSADIGRPKYGIRRDKTIPWRFLLESMQQQK